MAIRIGYGSLMLAFLTGTGFGLAAGWFVYVRRDWLVAIMFINGSAALTILFITVVMPSSSAAGSMHMSLWQFLLFVLERIGNHFLASATVWFVFSFVVGQIITLIVYQTRNPPPVIPEGRDERRRRIESEMGYTDSYFD
ncbi:hypothetical protein ACFFUB_08350 [Algimonas porphyrae]|uniref:Uncharacterized protein n=1 Tax=Algimonas porphyrae TaxID=1128113 RepID=A0ABQ5V652_9PROT|nr:hypothetical protein [Algimonas porphyrae]GLQ22056.1 hypothetical protein GCM10007854_30110 [Algimonas porphyrae]